MSLSNSFQAVTVNVLAYGDGLKVLFGMISEHIRIHFVSGTGPVEFSFNGSENHGQVGDPTSGFDDTIDMDIQRNEIWFKGAAGDEIVNITIWS